MMNMAPETDEEIARRVQRGDIEAFGFLIERYEGKMIRYARRFLFSDDDSKDLAQEVFIKSYVNIQSFDAEKRFSPWVYRIAHNEFVNEIKRRSRMPVFSFDPDTIFPHPTAEEGADTEWERKELRQMLDASFQKLNLKYREPLVLYYIEDMDYKEIAEVLQIPVSTVGVRLNRGKAMLKKLIQPYS